LYAHSPDSLIHCLQSNPGD
jgi:yeast amino acid transporter